MSAIGGKFVKHILNSSSAAFDSIRTSAVPDSMGSRPISAPIKAMVLADTMFVRSIGVVDMRRREFIAWIGGGLVAWPGALLVGDDPMFDVENHLLVGAASRYKIPTMYYVRDFVVTGGLLSYGPSFDEMAMQVGIYVGRILRGTKPADLPIQQPTKFELVISVKTAKALGLSIPNSMQLLADDVIE